MMNRELFVVACRIVSDPIRPRARWLVCLLTLGRTTLFDVKCFAHRHSIKINPIQGVPVSFKLEHHPSFWTK